MNTAAPDETVLFSIVVPVLNEAKLLPALLASLQSWRHRGAELIVVDGGSDDESRNIATHCADQVLQSKAGRARQMNLGASAAIGGLLVFLHADCEPDRQVFEALESVCRQNQEWGFFPVRLMGRHPGLKAIAAAMNLRSRVTAIGTGDQCLFVRPELFRRVGGFPDQLLMEDVEICLRLRRHARAIVPRARLAVSARRWERNGLLCTVLLMWRLRLAYFLGVSPRRLYAHYYG